MASLRSLRTQARSRASVAWLWLAQGRCASPDVTTEATARPRHQCEGGDPIHRDDACPDHWPHCRLKHVTLSICACARSTPTKSSRTSAGPRAQKLSGEGHAITSSDAEPALSVTQFSVGLGTGSKNRRMSAMGQLADTLIIPRHVRLTQAPPDSPRLRRWCVL
jgi:hypothetical protein